LRSTRLVAPSLGSLDHRRVMPYPTPKHLSGLLVADAKETEHEWQLYGTVRCTCGSDIFHPLYVAERIEDRERHFLRVAQVDGQWFCRIGARCTSCGREHLLFDAHFHGWNGYVCTDERVRRVARPPFQVWACQQCGATTHRVTLSIHGEGMEFALGESEDTLTEEDWFEAFGWIQVDVTCSACRFGPARIVDYETM